MGTSRSYTTPSGGLWTPTKTDISGFIGGDKSVTPSQIVGGVIKAGGLTTPPVSQGSPQSSAAARRASGRGGGGGGGGGGGVRAVGKTVSSLAGFAGTLRDGGLDAALQTLGLQDLAGRPAIEVVARIAEHLADTADGLQGETLNAALREALLEAAALEDENKYADLEKSLQDFINHEGVEGLVLLFLTHFVFDRIWLLIENHVESKSNSNRISEGMAAAVKQACRAHVEQHIDDAKAAGRFQTVDWFGQGGQRVGEQIIAGLESRLAALAPGDFE